jgi:hypothetical protein
MKESSYVRELPAKRGMLVDHERLLRWTDVPRRSSPLVRRSPGQGSCTVKTMTLVWLAG